MPGLSEWGFGAPSEAGFNSLPPGWSADEYDYGFGTPTSWLNAPPLDDPIDLATYQDAGFGSPIVLFVATPSSPDDIRDDGGAVVELVSSWPIHGPYLVTLIDSDGNRYPCYGLTPSSVDGAGGEAFTNPGLTKLKFASPRCPIGTYDVELTWYEAGQQLVLFEDLITVVYRSRFPDVYQLRRAFPPRAFKTGPRFVTGERVLGA